MRPAIAVLVLALAGLADMTYAAALHYGWLQSAPAAPAFCSVGRGSCQVALDAPQAELFGVDLSVLGMAFYVLMSSAATWRLARGSWPFRSVLIAGVVGAAIFSIYLAWTLFFVIGEPCKLCLFAHVMNLLMAGVMLSTLRGQRRTEHRAVLTPSG